MPSIYYNVTRQIEKSPDHRAVMTGKSNLTNSLIATRTYITICITYVCHRKLHPIKQKPKKKKQTIITMLAQHAKRERKWKDAADLPACNTHGKQGTCAQARNGPTAALRQKNITAAQTASLHAERDQSRSEQPPKRSSVSCRSAAAARDGTTQLVAENNPIHNLSRRVQCVLSWPRAPRWSCWDPGMEVLKTNQEIVHEGWLIKSPPTKLWRAVRTAHHKYTYLRFLHVVQLLCVFTGCGMRGLFGG